MVREIDRQRLNYMQAWIKKYDDGSEILMSYNTDVVKKTPDGRYIRLWSLWSSSTSKQVRAYCNRAFRSLPFEDGTVEDIRPIPSRKGWTLNKSHGRLAAKRIDTPYIPGKVARIVYALEHKDLGALLWEYNSACTKELLAHYKTNEQMKQIVRLLKECATETPDRYSKHTALAKLYDFDIKRIWDEGGIKETI